ncbi:MAG: hypothetical protein UU85_C0004G0003 [Candidatus Wolfebacteria bacterium GW2011_GWA2_42_10]|uniref:Glycosyltransferase RgtA/B/C/D-like domain-containing protein n=1 Tax=Candidatus Wolfebacteria bacterium GW2011_GWA2_42_10 TaxID=1619004 RepID=A0A0G0XK30_9BACT|nr:MAG: hypothetical protein UU85_C0004G0003 [Candidatus Wolfebacteria bacterium GW2011_GWA2_42_10]
MLSIIQAQKDWRKLAVIIILAMTVAVGASLPDIINYLTLKQNYEPFYFPFTSEPQFDEVTFYAPAASYFKENLTIPHETEIYEYKNIVNVKFFLPSAIEGGLAALTGNTRLSWIIIRLVFAALVFLLAYALARKLTGDRTIALFAVLILCTLGFGPRTFLSLIPERISQPIFFSRMNSPLVVLPFLLAGLIGLTKINTDRFRSGIAITGIASGLLFYTYYFHQIAFILTLIMLTICYFFLKEWRKMAAVIAASIIANILAVPWYLQYLKALKLSPGYITRWSAASYRPSFPVVIAAIAIIAAIFILKRKQKKIGTEKISYLPMEILIISAAGIQLIVSPLSPLIIQASHFYQQIVNSFGLFVIAILGGNYLVGKRRLRYLLPALGIILIVTLFIKQFAVWRQIAVFSASRDNEKIAEKLVEKNLSKEDVLAIANPYLNSVFPARLWRFRFYAFVSLSNVRDDENLERYVFTQRLFDKPWSGVDGQLAADPKTVLSSVKTISIPSLLTSKLSLSPLQRNDLKKFYDSASNDFINDKKITHAVALNAEEENGLIAGGKKLNLKTELIDKKDNVSLYKISAVGGQ